MENYKSASYQNDVIRHTCTNNEVFLYGPGYQNYNINDNINDIITKSNFTPDVIILGHVWLNDREARNRPAPKFKVTKYKHFQGRSLQ